MNSVKSSATMTDLYWYNWLWLFGKDNATIEEWRDNVVDKNVNSSLTFFIEVVIVVKTLHSTTPHHSVHLPHFIVLQRSISTINTRQCTG